MRKHPLADCDNCPLKDAACAPTDGPPGARIAVVSRSPGFYDVQEGRPFAGPSGKVLDHLLHLNGIERESVLVTNVVLCRSDKPPKEAIAACRLRLETEINASHTIIACGPEAASALAGVRSVNAGRGYSHKRKNFSGHEQDVTVTPNPAIVLHKAESFPDLVRDFRRALNPPSPPTFPEVRFTENVAEAKRWARTIESQPGLMGVDIESRGLHQSAPLIAIGFSQSGERAVTFGERACRDKEVFTRYLQPLLERRDFQYLWHNGKFDTRNLRHKGVRARVDEDSMLMSYALDERPGTHALEYLLAEYLGWGNYEPASVKTFKRDVMNAENRGGDVNAVEYDHEEMYTYNGWDVAGTVQLFQLLKERMDGYDQELYTTLLIPAGEVFRQIELNGITYDVEAAADLLEMEVAPKLKELQSQLQSLLGNSDYNPNSSTQNSKLVYDSFSVILQNRSIAARPAKQRSVDQPVYNEIIADRFSTKNGTDKELVRDWARRFRDFKQLDKQRSTYIQSLIKRAERDGGKIYTSFKIHGTNSGRLSSEKPNIQNITRPKPGVPNIRALFKAPEGCVIVQADYSQAELRCIAHFSQDPKLLAIYKSGEDLHSRVAERFYGNSFTKEQRSKAKNMDFGVAYGQSAETFQEKHDIPRDEASEFIKWWWSEFKGVAEWRDAVHKQALEENILINPFGRKKRIHLVTKENRNEILRESVNWYPQSTAHDFILVSIICLAPQLDSQYARNLLDGHDSIVCEVDRGYVDDAAVLLKHWMEQAPLTVNWRDIPFEAEVTTGPSWGEQG